MSKRATAKTASNKPIQEKHRKELKKWFSLYGHILKLHWEKEKLKDGVKEMLRKDPGFRKEMLNLLAITE